MAAILALACLTACAHVPDPVIGPVPVVLAPELDAVPQTLLDAAAAAPVTWTRTWGNDVMARHYPRAARSRGQEGNVVVVCDWDDNGYITNCAIHQETPAGEGFGAATVAMLKDVGRVGPKEAGTPLRAGKNLPTRVRWKLH